MRRVLTALAAFSIAASVLPVAAEAQSQRQRQRGGQQQQASGDDAAPRRTPRIAPLRRRVNAGPCPYVKVLYDAARYVEIEGGRAAVANVGYTGEIEGVSSDCEYRENDPIRVDMNVLFNLGRGAQAAGDQRTYRYWIAVTERNTAILSKGIFRPAGELPGSAHGVRDRGAHHHHSARRGHHQRQQFRNPGRLRRDA